MVYMDELPAIRFWTICHIEVWPDPEQLSTARTSLWTAEEAVASCGEKTLEVIRNAAYSLPDGGSVNDVYEAVKAEMGKMLLAAGFCYVDGVEEDMIVIGLPWEPRVSVVSSCVNRCLSRQLLAAEVMCA